MKAFVTIVLFLFILTINCRATKQIRIIECDQTVSLVSNSRTTVQTGFDIILSEENDAKDFSELVLITDLVSYAEKEFAEDEISVEYSTARAHSTNINNLLVDLPPPFLMAKS